MSVARYDEHRLDVYAKYIEEYTASMFQTWLKKEDPSFGDLRKVLNKQKEFLWVHRDFEKEY